MGGCVSTCQKAIENEKGQVDTEAIRRRNGSLFSTININIPDKQIIVPIDSSRSGSDATAVTISSKDTPEVANEEPQVPRKLSSLPDLALLHQAPAAVRNVGHSAPRVAVSVANTTAHNAARVPIPPTVRRDFTSPNDPIVTIPAGRTLEVTSRMNNEKSPARDSQKTVAKRPAKRQLPRVLSDDYLVHDEQDRSSSPEPEMRRVRTWSSAMNETEDYVMGTNIINVNRKAKKVAAMPATFEI